MNSQLCKICGAETTPIGSMPGKLRTEAFHFRRCGACGFTFVANPWTDFAAIYSKEYYEGKGADPMVDYEFELSQPALTVRRHEWEGIVQIVRSLAKVGNDAKWLDFGCGNGGLVRHCRSVGLSQVWGYDDGAIREDGIRAGVPYLNDRQLEEQAGTFDVITAIEVLEHVVDPLQELRRIRALLKKGGLLFLTTGNAKPHRDKFLKWRYVTPEIHVSYYEPKTLCKALALTGFRPEQKGRVAGFDQVIRFKILKNLGFRRHAWWQDLLPWGILSAAADRSQQVSAQPIGWAE